MDVDVDLVLDLVLSGLVPSVRRPNGRPLVRTDDVAAAIDHNPTVRSPN
ncbi:hypothetical protein [Euzebya sp.]